MIELKVYVPQDGPYGLVPKEGGEPVEEETCYLKSDVDKMIAELNMRIADGDEDFEIANNQIKRILKIVRHQKYKRCLAMAEWCDTEVGIADTDGNYEDILWYQKWYESWMELSEKFKEVESGDSKRAD